METGSAAEVIDGARYWQRRRRALWVAIAVALLLALGAGTVIGSGAFRSSPPDPVGSLEHAGIFHYATRSTLEVTGALGSRPPFTRAMLVDLSGGGERPVQLRLDYWYDPNRHLLYAERIVDGTVIGKSTESYAPLVATPLQEIALDELATLGVRRVVASGQGAAVGTSRLYGRPVSWVRFGNSQAGFEVATDARTGQPVAVETTCGYCTGTAKPTRLVDIGHVATAPTGFSRSPTEPEARFGFPGGFSSRSNPTPLPFSAAARALPRPTLYAGGSLGRLRLDSTQLVVTTTSPTSSGAAVHSRSVEFGYGTGPLAKPVDPRVGSAPRPAVSRFPPSVRVRESATPNVGGGFYTLNGHAVALGDGLTAIPIPPPGQALLAPATGQVTQLWLKRGGLYIEIQATSPALALEAARALRPVS